MVSLWNEYISFERNMLSCYVRYECLINHINVNDILTRKFICSDQIYIHDKLHCINIKFIGMSIYSSISFTSY